MVPSCHFKLKCFLEGIFYARNNLSGLGFKFTKFRFDLMSVLEIFNVLVEIFLTVGFADRTLADCPIGDRETIDEFLYSLCS